MVMSSLRTKLSALVQRRLQVERRSGRRVTPARQIVCMLHEPGEHEQITAIVYNLSFTGVALLAERAYPPDTLLHVLLVNAAHTFAVERDIKVVRCSRTADHFFLAGPFIRALAHDELTPFVL